MSISDAIAEMDENSYLLGPHDEAWQILRPIVLDYLNKQTGSTLCNCTRCLSKRAGKYVKGTDDYYKDYDEILRNLHR